MKIAIVSRTDGFTSGAGAVADLLATALRRRSHTIVRIVRHPSSLKGEHQGCDYIVLRRSLGDVAMRNAWGWDASGLRLAKFLERHQCDLVHFQDHAVAFGVGSTQHIARSTPVVTTFHDCSAFTGGCLMVEGCRRFEQSCGECPQVGQWPLVLPIDRTSNTHRKERTLAAAYGVVGVSPSRLYAEMAARGAWRNGTIRVVPNPVDVGVFTLRNRESDRRTLGFAESDRVILMVAADLADPRKGLDLLSSAFPRVLSSVPHARLVLVGRLAQLPHDLLQFESRVTVRGHITDRNALASTYAAADVVVLPSREENVPCTIAESLCCGTAVVAHDTGAVRELLQDPRDGSLSQVGDASALADALSSHLLASEADDRSNRAERAHRRWHPDVIAAAYEECYELARQSIGR
jgi:glycosyltransferase involved in cell wall biosynthesis